MCCKKRQSTIKPARETPHMVMCARLDCPSSANRPALFITHFTLGFHYLKGVCFAKISTASYPDAVPDVLESLTRSWTAGSKLPPCFWELPSCALYQPQALPAQPVSPKGACASQVPMSSHATFTGNLSSQQGGHSVRGPVLHIYT